MSCPSPVVHSMYADGALLAADAAAFEQHLQGCAECRARAAVARAEVQVLRGLSELDHAVPVPPLERPLGVAALLAIGAGAAVAAALAGTLWSALGAAVPPALRWLNPLRLGTLLDVSIGLFIFITREGQAMLTSVVEFAGTAVLAALLAAALFALLRRRAGSPALLALLVAAALPPAGHALEIRRGAPVMTIPAGETVNDTVVILGESVVVDGHVTGDLIAFARRVTVRGRIGGDLLTAAEIVDVEGEVTGNLLGFGRSVTLEQGRVGGNLYGFGSDVRIGTTGSVGGNAATFGNAVTMHGRVGIDVLSFARDLELRGEVMRHVEAFGQSVTVLPQARVGGNLSAHLPSEDDLRTSPGATIEGAIDAQVQDRPERRSKYLTGSFYFRQALRLGAAFVTGMLLLWLAPSLRDVPVESGSRVLRAAGLGLVTALVLPVVAVVALITIVGIPLGIAGLAAWGLGLYFAKIVLAQQIGRALFQAPHGVPHYAATLLAGLIVVIIAVNLPYVGGLANLALTLIGLGLIVGALLGRFRPPPPAYV